MYYYDVGNKKIDSSFFSSQKRTINHNCLSIKNKTNMALSFYFNRVGFSSSHMKFIRFTNHIDHPRDRWTRLRAKPAFMTGKMRFSWTFSISFRALYGTSVTVPLYFSPRSRRPFYSFALFAYLHSHWKSYTSVLLRLVDFVDFRSTLFVSGMISWRSTYLHGLSRCLTAHLLIPSFDGGSGVSRIWNKQ